MVLPAGPTSMRAASRHARNDRSRVAARIFLNRAAHAPRIPLLDVPMQRKLLFASLLALPALHYAIGSIGGAEAAPQAQVIPGGSNPAFGLCTNTLPQEPVLMYDVSGFGLGGQIHLHLSLYSNGLASISSAPGGIIFPEQTSGGFGGFFDPKAEMVFVDPAAVAELAENLALAGAFKACDEDAIIADIPLTTVTVFRGETNSRAHTFSYWTPLSPQTQAVGTLISEFIDKYFPNF